MSQKSIPIIDFDDLIDAIEALSAPSATNVSVDATGMDVITATNAQGAIKQLDTAVDGLNSNLTQKINKNDVKTYTLTGTTTSSGAIQMPLPSKTLIDFYLTSHSGIVFRRDVNYFTVYNNDLSAPIANTNVIIVIKYLDI